MRCLLIALLFSCAHASKPAKCPEPPRCLTTPQCAWNEETGCNECQCSDAMIDRGHEAPPGQAPYPNH